jgi:hypothetical protein
MATEVLAVGIDFSFAPVLDLNDISDVIGDRGFAKNMQDIVHSGAFMRGMKQAGMANWKTFPGHGSVKLIHMSLLQLIVAHIKKFMTKICKALSNYAST